jgi:2-phospho-L-lactate/phosphoenolpyruvate guanylyltransferase
MGWTAIVPVKPSSLAKSRLSEILGPSDRAELANFLLDHVLGVLREVPALTDIALLCRDIPAGWAGRRIADEGGGLNLELEQAARAVAGPLLIVHADLPMLRAADISALLHAASRGMAIAPDRHGTGTNALALPDPRQVRFAFGPGSLKAHRLAAPGATIVCRPGLAYDLDTPEDFAALLASRDLDPAMRNALADLSVSSGQSR